MDINKEIAEHTTQVEAIITKYLPKEAAANADAGDLQAV